ncbi:hypothetical protein PR202_gb05614 [Eleusine coracana subsp. coracana]|uniref:F-box domain-containing protein n=1 Tax=Eleusine coracana subsp. coracana TaxID=191504 RepID=A0AAV5E7G5_ELECO|nr:hypothetical protein PR202_gb05614 [Eleusine coracana subsp. coracana]
MLEIFLRLPSLATLVRAAYACRSWGRTVASSPAFRRRLRALHPSPLLGHFYNSESEDVPVFPSSSPPVSSTETSLPLSGTMTFYSLPSRTAPRSSPAGRFWTAVVATMFNTDEDSGSFRVAFLAFDNDSRLQSTVFSSNTGVWSVNPLVEFPEKPDDDDDSPQIMNMMISMQENGFLYWVYTDQRYIISLDTATMKFCTAELPAECLMSQFAVSETTDEGTACLVYSHGSNIGVLTHTRGGDGVERWVEDRIIPLDTELDRVLAGQFDHEIELNIYGVCNGYAYLTTSTMDTSTQHQYWFLSLCLETMKLKKLFRRKIRTNVLLYFMAWPPSLLGNCERFASEDTPLVPGASPLTAGYSDDQDEDYHCNGRFHWEGQRPDCWNIEWERCTDDEEE